MLLLYLVLGLPDYIPCFGVLWSRVDNDHQADGGGVADVIVDHELEVGDVDKGQISWEQIRMQMWHLPYHFSVIINVPIGHI